MKIYTDLEQKMIIAENLKDLINKSGKDQRQIAIELDINPPTFNQWVTGKATPQVSTLRKVANRFHVPLSYLINNHNDPQDNDEDSGSGLPLYYAQRYQELNTEGKETINNAIEAEYKKEQERLERFKKALGLEKITTIDEARDILGDVAAYGGYASEKTLINMANKVLQENKKKR